MAGVPHYQPGDQVTRKVGVAAVRTNRLVEAQNDGTIREAVAGSTRVEGMPHSNANPGEDVTVARGMVLPIVYATAANYGDELMTYANGEVGVVPAAASAGASPTAAEFTSAINNTRATIARCEAPLGVAVGGIGSTFVGKI